MGHIRVTAPYVTLKVDRPDGTAVLGFYEGAVLSADSVDADQLQRHLDRGYVEEVSDAEDRDDAELPPNLTVVPQPGQNDPKADWVDYAVSKGMSREEAEATTKADLIEALKD